MLEEHLAPSSWAGQHSLIRPEFRPVCCNYLMHCLIWKFLSFVSSALSRFNTSFNQLFFAKLFKSRYVLYVQHVYLPYFQWYLSYGIVKLLMVDFKVFGSMSCCLFSASVSWLTVSHTVTFFQLPVYCVLCHKQHATPKHNRSNHMLTSLARWSFHQMLHIFFSKQTLAECCPRIPLLWHQSTVFANKMPHMSHIWMLFCIQSDSHFSDES